MLPSLWLNNASSTPPELIIREGEQVLGRSADADICLDETFVSGYHARLNWNTMQLAVLDLDSTNGTLVNGVPVVGWTSLTDGDVIEFGGVEATVRLPMESEPNPVLGNSSHPPPPAPSRRRPERQATDTDPTGAGLVAGDPRLGLAANKGGESEDHQNDSIDDHEFTQLGSLDSDDAPARPGRTFGTQLGPVVSDQTEPLFDQPVLDQTELEQPLTSAVTLPPTPPAGLSVTEVAGTTGGYEDLDDSGFDFGDHNSEHRQRSSPFDRQGLKLTVGTAAAVFVALVLVATVIIFLMQR